METHAKRKLINCGLWNSIKLVPEVNFHNYNFHIVQSDAMHIYDFSAVINARVNSR